MLGREAAQQGPVSAGSRPRRLAAAQRAQRVEDHRDVDALLQQRAERGREQAERGDHHRRQRHRHARQRALHGDPPGAAGDLHRVGEPVEPVGGEHHVGRLRGGGRAAGAHRHPDRGGGERGGVVEAVADHHGDRAFPLGAHGGDLARGRLLGAHLVEPQDLRRPPGPVRAGPR